jgi:hypothetical protein
VYALVLRSRRPEIFSRIGGGEQVEGEQVGGERVGGEQVEAR